MRSETAALGDPQKQPRSKRPTRGAFPQLKAGVVGLAGLEPAASSLSEIDGGAPCYPAFPQLAMVHEKRRDGVNHAPPLQLAVAVCWRTHGLPVGAQSGRRVPMAGRTGAARFRLFGRKRPPVRFARHRRAVDA